MRAGLLAAAVVASSSTTLMAASPAGATSRSQVAEKAAKSACQEFSSRIKPVFDEGLQMVSVVANIATPSDGTDPVQIVASDAARAAHLSKKYRALKSDAQLLESDTNAATNSTPVSELRDDAGLVKGDCKSVK
jgi:hypothetical protein